MKNMTLKNIAEACRGQFVGDESLLEKEISGVEKDSRIIEEGYLYLPFVGANVDGHDFIPQVFEKGALCTLSEKDLTNSAGPYIKVESVGVALKDIAEFYRKQLTCKIIGITGSVGKTTTKEMIASVLQEKFSVLKTEGNYNNEIGMPLTILKIRENHEIAVIEMGISGFEEMHRLAKVARPDVCVITNIGTCHLDNLGDRDGVFKAKTEMFDYAQKDCFVVLNGDDDKLSQVSDVNGNPPMFFGVKTPREVRVLEYSGNIISGTDVTIQYKDEKFETHIPNPGFHMLYNAMAATCIGKHFGMSFDEISAGIRNYKAIAGRSDIFKVNNITVIDGCYNANPMSMESSLRLLADAKGRKVAILGDMFELGDNKEALHRQVGSVAAELQIDKVICIGELAKYIAQNAQSQYTKVDYFPQKDAFENVMTEYIKEGDTVLIKASNGMKFKTLVERLKVIGE